MSFTTGSRAAAIRYRIEAAWRCVASARRRSVSISIVVALAPLHRAAGIQRINIATYQSVSGTGRRALEELGRQTAGLDRKSVVEGKRVSVRVVPGGRRCSKKKKTK